MWCAGLKHLYYFRFPIIQVDVHSSRDRVLGCFWFSELVIKLCKAIVTGAGGYAYFCSFVLVRIAFLVFLQGNQASRIFKIFLDNICWI